MLPPFRNEDCSGPCFARNFVSSAWCAETSCRLPRPRASSAVGKPETRGRGRSATHTWSTSVSGELSYHVDRLAHVKGGPPIRTPGMPKDGNLTFRCTSEAAMCQATAEKTPTWVAWPLHGDDCAASLFVARVAEACHPTLPTCPQGSGGLVGSSLIVPMLLSASASPTLLDNANGHASEKRSQRRLR